MCSLIRVAHVVLCVLVLVGVRRVTVVIIHIGHDEVVVVIHFSRSHFCQDFLYQEMYSLHHPSVTIDCVDCNNHDRLCTKFFLRFMSQMNSLVH